MFDIDPIITLIPEPVLYWTAFIVSSGAAVRHSARICSPRSDVVRLMLMTGGF